MRWIGLAIGLTIATIAAGRVEAQRPREQPAEMNFDMWCQEQRHLPPERCDKRLPQDDARFDAYRSKIESYEMVNLQHRRVERRLNRTILHYDPVDNPAQPATPPSSQPPR